jgi:hypothetical protein
LGNGFVEVKYSDGKVFKVVPKNNSSISENKSDQTLFKLAMAGVCQRERRESL